LNKAPDAFRTISEVAEELDLPQHVLRFWESRFPHIKPVKRGGGRRYYRPDDIDLLRGIRRLLYSDGYTIKGVQRILREQGVRTVQSVGQGQEVPNLAALSQDGPGGEDGRNGAVATAHFLTSDPHPPGDEDDKAEALAMMLSTPTPKNGPIAKAGMAAVAQVGRLEATKGEAPVAAVAVAVSSGALAAPTIAAQDLDRLKKALAELEACRRLLEKAIEEGR